MKKRNWNYDPKECCPFCGSFKIVKLSGGEILCKNKSCMAVCSKGKIVERRLK